MQNSLPSLPVACVCNTLFGMSQPPTVDRMP